MARLLSRLEKKPTISGDSTAVVIPSEWLKIAGIDKETPIVIELSYSERNKQHFVAIYSKDKPVKPESVD